MHGEWKPMATMLFTFVRVFWLGFIHDKTCHNFLTHNWKLSHGEWKAFDLDFFKPNTWNWSNFCRFSLNLFKSSKRFLWVFSAILFTIVCIFWLGIIRDKITITFWPITANYRTVNGNLLAWIFSSQILKIDAPFAVWPEFIQAKHVCF